MSKMKWLCLALLLPFSALSLYAVAAVGYVGILDYHRHSPAGWQVFADLVVGMILLLAVIHRDARRNGRAFWPYAIVTVFLGSFGPLAYFLLAPSRQTVPEPAGG